MTSTTPGVEAASIGLLAAEALGRAKLATVLARFERSFCLDLGGELITIGDESLHDGPLTIKVKAAAFPVDVGTGPGQAWTVDTDRLQSADGLHIDLARAIVWRPTLWDGVLDSATLDASLGTLLQDLTAMSLPEEGLIRLALPDAVATTPVEKAAAPALASLRRWLARALRGTPGTGPDSMAGPDSVESLIGLGPGLTPSGDDLLSGVLIACHHIGDSGTAERLGHAIDAVVQATHRISRAHLHAAARGYGGAPLHDLLDVLVTGRRSDLAQALDAAAKIGHSSGLDAIAGLILALTAWLETDFPLQGSV